MNRPILALVSAVALAASALPSPPAMAQGGPAPAVMPSDQLYKAFGAQPGLIRMMDDFMVNLLADPRTGPQFKPANQQHVKEQLVDQFCALMGGPCQYKGADMATAHGNLDITKADFNALVEVLQVTMDAQGVAFSAQNKLLAKLAPMYREVITVK